MSVTQNNNPIKKDTNTKAKITPDKHPLRRGPLAKKLLIKGENLREFEDLQAHLLSETLPQTKIENILVEKIISATWKLQRAMLVEKTLLNEQNAITYDERYPSDVWEKIPPRIRIRNIKKIHFKDEEIKHLIQYQIDLEKGLQKALVRLRREQSLRKQLSSPPQA